MLEVEIHPALDENHAGCGTEENWNRRLTSKFTPVEQGQDFATSTGSLDREEISEVSNLSNENAAGAGSSASNTMTYGVTEKLVTSSSFSERVKNTLGIFFPFIMGT